MSDCYFCEKPITGTDDTAWQLVIGWQRKAHGESRRGGSDIALRRPYGEGDGETWACDSCIRKARLGVDPRRQETML